MKVSFKLFFLALLFTSICAVSAKSSISSINIDVFPTSGDITTNITIQVRGDPYTRDYITSQRDYPVLTIYYDDIVIANRIKCVTRPKVISYSYYEASWDYSFKLPNEYPYSELGDHVITAKVEATDGSTATNTATFTIVNYIPPPEWWEDLPPEFIDSITGPMGPPGEIGPVGSQGVQGEDGESYPQNALYYTLGASTMALLVSIYVLSKTHNE